MQFQQDNHKEEVNKFLRSFTQDFVREFEKKLIDCYQEMMGEIQNTSGVPELVVQGLGTILGALGGAVVGLPGLGAEMGAKLGRKAGEKAKEYAPELGRRCGERAWIGWLGEKAGEKAGEYAPGLGEKAGENIGRSVGEEVKKRVCDYINNIKDYLSGKAHKSKAEKVVEMTAHLLFDNKLELRSILVEAIIDVFWSFESQFVRITAESGSIIIMRKKFAVDTVERVINYIDNQKQNDPRISSDLVTKGIILGSCEKNALATFKFFQAGSGLVSKKSSKTWKTSELYENVGLLKKEDDGIQYYKKKGNNTDECGHRRLLNWEEKEWNSKLKYQYEVEIGSIKKIYNYVLKVEDLKEKSIDILKEINDEDSVLQLERKDLVDAAEEGARKALNIQLQSKSSCFVMEDPVWSFTGRDKELNTIHETMQNNADIGTLLSRMIVITGLGGMGKSELARKYAHKYRLDYDGNVIWINAEKHEDLVGSFRKLAKKLIIPTEDKDKERDIESIVKDVYEYFSKSKSLFIFDNVEKYKSETCETDKDRGEQNVGWYSKLLFPISFLLSKDADNNKVVELQDAGIDRFLPLSSLPDTRPYFLITSRNRDWVSGLTILELQGLELNDAVSFVKKALSMPESDKLQEKEIEMLVKRLDNYPLALQQAVAFIRSQKKEEFKLSDYLKEYDEETEKFYDFKDIDNYTETILATWKVTTDKIANDKEYGKLALDILNIVAYFPPDDIKREVFLNLADGVKEKLNSAVELLVKYSMVNGRQYQSIFDIHRLVQKSTRIRLRKENKEDVVLMEALRLFRDDIKESNVNYVISVWKYASKRELLIKEFSKLPAEIIMQLKQSVRYNEAYLFGRETFELLKKVLGAEHRDTLAIQNNIALVLDRQGRYAAAWDAFQHVFNKRKNVLGPDDPDTLSTQYNMALVLYNQGKYEAALEAFQHLLDKENAILGPDHPSTLMTQSIIANIYSQQGKNSMAIKTCLKVLDKRETILDSDLESMALIYYRRDKYNKSLELYKEATDKKKAILGPDHPDTLNICNNMAAVFYKSGKYSEASKLYTEVLEKRRAILGPDHPDTLITWGNMIDVLSKQGKYNESLQLYKELLDKKTIILGSNHPSTLSSKANMASVLCDLGKYLDALCIYEEVYAIAKRTDVLGPNHPDTLTTRHNLMKLREWKESRCSIQLCEKQKKAYLLLSQFVSHYLQNASIESIKPGLFLPSFEARNVKINGKCTVFTRGFSQALSLKVSELFLSNLRTSAEIYERIAQGKQVSKREERVVFAFSKLFNVFEQQLNSSMNSLPLNLIYCVGYKTLKDLSNYISEVKRDFTIHLVASNHVVAIYKTGGNYIYFDSNVSFVFGLKSVNQLMKVVKRGVESAGYKIEKKGFLVEHFNVEQANQLLSSEDKQVLTKEIKTERQLLAEQDKLLGLLKINSKEISRVQLYDLGTKINVKGSVPLLINAHMNLSSKLFQDYLLKQKISMTAREYLDNLKKYKNIAQATKGIPIIGSKREIKEANQGWQSWFKLLL